MAKAELIKKLRIKLGLTQTEVANRIGVSKQTLYKYENGIITNIPSDKVELLANVLETDPKTLMGWGDEESKTLDQYYLNEETREIAQEVFENKDLRILFDAARDARPEDLKMAADLLKRFKETNPDG